MDWGGCVRRGAWGVQGEDGDSCKAEDDAAEGESCGALGTEEEDFSGEDPDGDHGGDDGGDAGGDADFGPEEPRVEAGEHDEAEGGGVEDLTGAELDGPGEAAPEKKDEAGEGEAEACGQEWGDDGDNFADGEEGSAPQYIDGGVGEEFADPHKTGYRVQVTGKSSGRRMRPRMR